MAPALAFDLTHSPRACQTALFVGPGVDLPGRRAGVFIAPVGPTDRLSPGSAMNGVSALAAFGFLEGHGGRGAISYRSR